MKSTAVMNLAINLAVYLSLTGWVCAENGDMHESEQIISRRAAMSRLHAAVRVGDPAMLDAALADGADIDRSSALELAILMERPEMIDLLIERGADVNRAGPSGDLPVAIAARRGNLSLMRRLIDKGADPMLRDRRGMSALDHAQNRGRADIVQYLNRPNVRDGSTHAR